MSESVGLQKRPPVSIGAKKPAFLPGFSCIKTSVTRLAMQKRTFSCHSYEIHDNKMFTVLARRPRSRLPRPHRCLPTPGHDSILSPMPWRRGNPHTTGDLTEHALIDRSRRRSLGFLDWEEETWSCFLVTFVGRNGQWHGHLAFRPRDGEGESDEVRTADIFIEASEADIDHKARGLGRPLVKALLSSALHTWQGGEVRESLKTRRWFKKLLLENSRELSASAEQHTDHAGGELGTVELRSLYESYRLDQVCHFIALVDPERFEATVDSILEGRRVDFSAKDRLQLGMIVIEYIEERIPMPPFEVWIEDFLAHREEYVLYTHTLHREGRLP